MKKVFHAIGKLITNQEKSKSGLQIILVQSVEHRYMYMQLFQNKQISSTNSPITSFVSGVVWAYLWKSCRYAFTVGLTKNVCLICLENGKILHQ